MGNGTLLRMKKNEKQNDEETYYVQHDLLPHEYEQYDWHISDLKNYGNGHFLAIKKKSQNQNKKKKTKHEPAKKNERMKTSKKKRKNPFGILDFEKL